MAFVVGVFSHRIIGWRVSRSMQAEFVLDALKQALYDGMAGQVRPWRTEPDWLDVLPARPIDGGVRQHIPSGTEAKPHSRSGCVVAIFLVSPSSIEACSKQGQPCMSQSYSHGQLFP